MHVWWLEQNIIKQNKQTALSLNNKINGTDAGVFNVAFFPPVFLDGLKPKEELLAAVYKDICQEIQRLRGKSVCLILFCYFIWNILSTLKLDYYILFVIILYTIRKSSDHKNQCQVFMIVPYSEKQVFQTFLVK